MQIVLSKKSFFDDIKIHKKQKIVHLHSPFLVPYKIQLKFKLYLSNKIKRLNIPMFALPQASTSKNTKIEQQKLFSFHA